MGMHTLEDLYVRQLEDLYDAERQFQEILPRVAREAVSPELKSVLERHHQHIEIQMKRLEKIFEKAQKSPVNRNCLGMKSLIQEYEEVMGDDISTIISDWALIEAVKKMEHYEIAAYRSIRSYARLLKDGDAVGMLTRTINEKYQLDDELCQIADEQAKWMGHIYWASWRSGWGVFIGRPASSVYVI